MAVDRHGTPWWRDQRAERKTRERTLSERVRIVTGWSTRELRRTWITAQHALRRLVARGKSKKRAIVAVANRLAQVAYAVLRDHRGYEARPPRQKEEVAQKRAKIETVTLTRPNTPQP